MTTSEFPLESSPALTSHVVGVHSNVTSRFTVQALADCIGAGMSSDMLAAQAMGGSVRGLPIGTRVTDVSTTQTMVDGQLRWLAVWVPRAVTLQGVKILLSTQGAYTADNNNRIGLYSLSGTTATLVASTANDGNLWKATADVVTAKAFSVAYAAAAGVYYLAWLWNHSATTTDPVQRAFPALASGIGTLDLTAGLKFSGVLAGQTDLPATQDMSAVSGASSRPFVYLY